MQTLAEIFGPDGALARRLPGFRFRPPQQRMAELVGEAVATGSHAVLEAGTGIGKTFAYLVPVLLGGRRAVISTGTRALQDQLFERDLPVLGQVLGRPVDVTMLKGRGNYLCWERINRALERGLRHRETGDRLAALADWGRKTDSGDLSEFDELEDDYRTLALATSTADNCLGSRCGYFDECFVARARRRAQSSEVVIVNHHLLLADLALKDRGFGELLPLADVVVVDEAHLLPDIAQQFFGLSLSSRELERVAADTADAASLRHETDLADAALGLATRARSLRSTAGAASGRLPWAAGPVAFREALHKLDAPLTALARHLEAVLETGREHAVFERCAARLKSAAERLATILDAGPQDGLRWLDLTERGVTAHLTPFDTAEALGARIEAHAGTWVFASATLAVDDDFDHFIDRIGVDAPLRATLPSPFDYRRNGRIHVPDGMPAPGQPDHTACFVDAVLPLIEAAGGGAFLLFTSHRALGLARDLLAARHCPWPVLIQGAAPRTRLLEQFRDAGDAVLLGTGAFWQGVDVRGAALKIVAIDKLPFAVPDDPIVKARIEALRRAGDDPFPAFQLPQAVLALKQGVGRLIRDYDDRGLIVLGDPRLKTRPYGRLFLASLPPMPVVADCAEAVRFAASLKPAAAPAGGREAVAGI